jgi:hypothetical protein
MFLFSQTVILTNLRSRIERVTEAPIPSLPISALAYAGIGDRDHAMEWLENDCQHKTSASASS